MLDRIRRKCRTCGRLVGADFRGEECDDCGSQREKLDWWFTTGTDEGEGYWLAPRLEEFLASHQYDQILATLKPIEHILGQTDKLSLILTTARDLYAAELPKHAREWLLRGEIDQSVALCLILQREFSAQPEAWAQLRHDIVVAIISRSEEAMLADDWHSAQTFAQKALEVEPTNPDAERLRADAEGKLHLKGLAARAFAAYRDRDLAGCRSACEAFSSFRKANDIHVDFTYPDTKEVIDFTALPEKLRQEIEALRYAEMRMRAEQASVQRAIVFRRLVKLATACAVVVVLVMAMSHWRKVRFEKRVRAFDTVFHAQSYDAAKAIAPKIAGKYTLAADLLAYFRSRASFETALTSANAGLLQQYGATKWADLQAQKQAAEASAGTPARGVEEYQRATALLTECQALADAGEKARKEKESRDKAMAEAKAKEEREQAERKRIQEEREAEQLRARVRKDVESVSADMSQNTPMGNAIEALGSAAVSSWKAASDNGWGEGQILMGLCYQFGIHVDEDSAKGRTLIRRAAEQGIGLAEFCMAVDIDTRRNPESRGEMISWMKRAAEHGVARAQATLGGWYMEGSGSLAKDTAAAAKWFKLAAENGNASAQHQLGVCYFYGVGVMKDVDESLKWIRLAARNGEPFAQYSLSTMYRSGTGVEEDTSQALEWCKKAAAQGHAGAQNDLGVAYLRGDGVYRNVNEAVRWFRLAAQQGNETAISNLQDLNVAPSGWLYKCSRCGRVKKYSRKVVTAACSQCISGDMQFIGPAY